MKAPGEYAKIMLPELTFPYLIPGQEVLLDDGKIHLKIVEKAEKEQISLAKAADFKAVEGMVEKTLRENVILQRSSGAVS